MDEPNQSPRRKVQKIKVVLLGQRGVGKTTLVNKLQALHSHSTNNQSMRTTPNMGCEFYSLKIENARLHIWDTCIQRVTQAGSHNSADYIRLHLHEVDVVVLMYSVVEFTSCSELVFWSKLAQGLGCRVVLVANKIDDRFSFQKREEEIIYGKTLADKRGYEFVAISALTGEKVEELVGLMIKEEQSKQESIQVENQTFSIGLTQEESRSKCRCKCTIF